jgi:hypothetical protein
MISAVQQTPQTFRGERTQRVRQKVTDNSTEITVGGGAGLATFGTLRNSSKIGTSIVNAIKNSKNIKIEKQAQILKLLGKFKPLAKHVNNPIFVKVAGGLAGLSAMTTLIGSSAKILDTCTYLKSQNQSA